MKLKKGMAVFFALIKGVLVSVFFITGLFVFMYFCVYIWLIGTQALPDNLGVGYYRDFDIARQAIKQSACAKSIGYSRHEDLTLEDFHFIIRTESGSLVRLWFHHGMDVEKVCSKPPGFLVMHPHNWKFLSQGYTIEELSARLADKGIRVANVNDVLCNIDHLAPMFKANYNDETIPRFTYRDANFDRYLSIEIVEPGEGNEFDYNRIR